MIEVGPDLPPPDPGRMETTTWGEVGIGNIVRDKKDHLWTVSDEKNGWALLSRRTSAGVVETIGVPKFQKLGESVDIYVPSETEAKRLLHKALGAHLLVDIEAREHSIARALNWRMEPLGRSAKDIRDHIDMIHGVNVDDVLRKWQGTQANPSDRGKRAAALAELRQAHDEMHADPDMWPMAWPHVHTLDPKETH